VLCTEWAEFRHPDFHQIAKRLKHKVIFDGRNIYRRSMMQQLGFAYHSVGRPPVGDKPQVHKSKSPKSK
jgi:UDPglucose 6-dehydrogenase